jgi:hypothetical protein
MKKFYFSALILFLLSISLPGYAQVNGFNAYFENNIVMLHWQTGNETNTDHFVVEHGTDGIHFAPMHEIVARGDDSANYYEDGDSYPDTRTNFYRLKEVSKDDQVFYSPVMRVDNPGKLVPVLKPTIVYKGSTVRLDPYYLDQPLTINFYNTAGMRMGSYLVNSSSFDINTATWGKGLYFYRISDPIHPLISAGKIMVM